VSDHFIVVCISRILTIQFAFDRGT